MTKYGLISFNKDSFIMETDKSIEIAEEEIVEDEEVDRCNHLMLIQIVENSSL